MELKVKINKKRYFGYTLGAQIGFAFFCRSAEEFIGLILVYLCVLANHYFYLKAVDMMTDNALSSNYFYQNEASPNRSRVFFYFALKFIILAMGLTIGVHLMGIKVILAILGYVFQIFVLVLSIENEEGQKAD